MNSRKIYHLDGSDSDIEYSWHVVNWMNHIGHLDEYTGLGADLSSMLWLHCVPMVASRQLEVHQCLAEGPEWSK